MIETSMAICACHDKPESRLPLTSAAIPSRRATTEIARDVSAPRTAMLASGPSVNARTSPIGRAVIDNTMGVTSLDPTWGSSLTPDMDKVKAAAAAVFGETPSGPTVDEVARQAIQSEAARVVVLNGTTEGGLGTEVAAGLTADGFQVVAVGNADRADYGQSVLITYGDGLNATREALVSRFGMPPDRVRSESPSETVDFTLVVGEDLASANVVQ